MFGRGREGELKEETNCGVDGVERKVRSEGVLTVEVGRPLAKGLSSVPYGRKRRGRPPGAAGAGVRRSTCDGDVAGKEGPKSK